MDHFVTCCKQVYRYNLVFERGRFWPLLGDQFLEESHAVYVHLREHIMKFWRHFRKTEKESSENNFISLITGWTAYTEKYKAQGPDV